MNRTITVKGTGRISLPPDTAEVSLTVRTLDPVYEKAMAQSAELLEQLRAALESIGFDKNELKTEHFQVYTEHESLPDERGNYRSVFKGYACVHGLKLAFPFESGHLARVLASIGGCLADPELNLRFTVRDEAAARDALLQNAAADARHRAEILAAASGVTLGELVCIDYNWSEIDICSPSRFDMARPMMAKNAEISIAPENAELSDTASFTWELK